MNPRLTCTNLHIISVLSYVPRQDSSHSEKLYMGHLYSPYTIQLLDK